MLKPSLRKNLSREIRSTLSRFIAIFAITALGAGFYTGLKSTGPDMLHTAQQYFAGQRLADFRLLSTMGFTEDDIAALQQSGDWASVQAGYGVDALVESAEGPEAVRLLSMPEEGTGQNLPTLTAGRLPQNPDECLADSAGPGAIGDVIRLSAENSAETLDLFRQKEFTVVGLASSPSYISFTRGNTNIGSGRILMFYLVPKAAFDTEYFTEIYLQSAQAEGLAAYSDAYKEAAGADEGALEAFGEQRAELRYEDIYSEGSQTLAEAREDLAEGRAEYDQQRGDAEAELADAESQLNEGAAELAEGRQEVAANTARLADGAAQLAGGEAQLAQGQALAAENRAKLEAGQKEFDTMQATLNEGRARYEAGLAQYEAGAAAYEAGLAGYKEGKATYDAQLALWQAGKNQYDAALAAYQAQQAAYEGGLALVSALGPAGTALQDTLAQMGALQAAAEGGDAAAAAQFTALATAAAGSLRELAGQLAATGGDASALLSAAEGAEAALAGGQYAAASAALSGAGAALPQVAAGLQAQLDAAKPQLDAAKTQLEASKIQIDAGKAPLDEGAATLAASKARLEESKAQLDAAKTQLDANATVLADGQAQLDEAAATLAAGWQALAAGEAQLASGAAETAAARQQLAEGQAQLDKANQTLATAARELQQGWSDYDEARAKAEEEFTKAEKELADAENEIADGQRELDELEKPKWYVFSREDNPGYTGFESDTHRIDSIALIFPVFFFLVATLICLTTMTRMVEENRTEIGTFKALGYPPGAIAFKYLFYGFVASFLGSLTGVVVGSYIFPVAIWQAYSIMYIMPPLAVALHPVHAPASILACVLCTLLATLAACLGELRSVPAELMRPKAPRPGKRIFLERVRPLWRRMSFTQKVTSRNIFRYKKRFFMTVIGVAGCTALLLTGFGLRDSIRGVVGAQFEDIFHYNLIASLASPSTAQANTPLNRELPGFGESLYVAQSNLDASFNGHTNANMTTTLFVAEEPEKLPGFIQLQNRQTGEDYPLPQEGGALLTEKLAGRLGAAVGDSIEISLSSDREATAKVRVEGVVENYLQNYVYLSPATYKTAFGTEPEYNAVLIKTQAGSPAENEILENLINAEGVAGAVSIADHRAEADDMLEGLDAVVWVVIASAGLLAFVVLYNLTNINITERAREIATLKVLGFYPREVASYIYRESLFLTLIGAAFGLALGVFLHQFVISAAEIDEVMFRRVVMPLSYLWSLLFTLLSVALVDAVMLRRLKKIDMVESLKSAE